jgi:hypothetical protein
MQTTTHPLIDDYVDRLHAALADLPPERRHEIVEEIQDHIDDASAGTEPTEAQLRTLLDRLGDPADIAAEARERLDVMPPPPVPRRRLEAVALVLLLPGSLLVPFIGWVIGVVLVWMSDIWDTRDKWVATLLPPGGLFTGLIVSAMPVWDSETCSGGETAAGRSWEHCTGGPSNAQRIAGVVLALFLILSPFVTTGYLAWRLRQVRLRPSSG